MDITCTAGKCNVLAGGERRKPPPETFLGFGLQAKMLRLLVGYFLAFA
jgi:hypothetical protein